MPKPLKLPYRPPPELRFARPDWFPDWKGQTVVIIGGGPSAAVYNYKEVRDRAKFIVINKAWKLVPDAEVLIGADGGFWNKYKGVPKFTGIKLTADFHASRDYGLTLFHLDKMTTGISMTMPAYVGMGCNTGFYAVNFALQFGPPKKIILTGFEMNLLTGVHWHGNHERGLNNPGNDQFRKWAKILDGEADKIRKMGVTVINASLTSSLKNYRKMGMTEAFEYEPG